MQMARSLTIMERSRMVAGGKIDALKKKVLKISCKIRKSIISLEMELHVNNFRNTWNL